MPSEAHHRPGNKALIGRSLSPTTVAGISNVSGSLVTEIASKTSEFRAASY